MSNYGTSVNQQAGATVPVNTAALFPALKIDDPTTALKKLTYTQSLTRWFGVYAGKLETLEADNNAFAHDFRSQLSKGLQFHLAAALAAISAWGGGVVAIPWEGAVLSVSVLDPHGTPTDNSFDQAFDRGIARTPPTSRGCSSSIGFRV